ncbi:MAG: 50S ribosomal protein L15e [Candidatus Woesearchaeota archaeon]
MGYLKYLRDAWKKPSKELLEQKKQRKIEWRKQPATVRVDHPTRLDRAKSLGYKAKQGFLVVRQRVKRGGRMTEKVAGGRRPGASGRNKVVDKNYQRIAEERVQRKYVNCEVLNSYYVDQDGQSAWYEVILVDATHPRVLSDKNVYWTFLTKGRVFRGLTSSGKKSRGLRHKGLGSEKTRQKNKK